jgi:transposase
VRRYLHPFQASMTAPPPVPIPPSVRQVTGWLTRRPDTVNAEESLELKKILDRSPTLTTTYQHVREFAEMLTQRQGQLLTDWLQEVEANGAPALRSFANGLPNDLDAVAVGLTTDYSSGVVEGTDNRIRRSSDRCTGEPNSTYYASESSTQPDQHLR